MPLVVVDELHKQFGEAKVLRGVNLTVEEGDVVAVIGRSGSGKSAFLRILNGLETFDAGIVKIDGSRVSGLESDLAAPAAQGGHGFSAVQPFSAPYCWRKRHAGCRVKSEPEAEVRRPCRRSARQGGPCRQVQCLFPTAFGRAAALARWPLPARWPCAPRCCCATK